MTAILLALLPAAAASAATPTFKVKSGTVTLRFVSSFWSGLGTVKGSIAPIAPAKMKAPGVFTFPVKTLTYSNRFGLPEWTVTARGGLTVSSQDDKLVGIFTTIKVERNGSVLSGKYNNRGGGSLFEDNTTPVPAIHITSTSAVLRAIPETLGNQLEAWFPEGAGGDVIASITASLRGRKSS